MKVNSTVYKGIEFIEISSLPNDQKGSLLETLDPELFIKIMVDGKLIPRCLQFKDYEAWYDSSFNSVSSNESKPALKTVEKMVNADLPV